MQVCVYLLLVLHAADGCTLEHHSEREIVGYAGESVLLPCFCTNTHTRPERFTWEKHNTHTNTWDVISSESEQYRNRVQLGTAHSPGNLSLLISHLTEEDDGQYRCHNKENEYRYITLYVSVCKEDAKKKPLTEVSGYVGGFVLLPCYCTQLLTNPKTLRWSFTDESNIIYPTDQTNRYTGRIQLVTAPGNFSLFICGLTKEDLGDYRCKISSDHVIHVKLKVTEGRNPTSVGTDNSCPTVSGKATTTVTTSTSSTASTSPTTSTSTTTSTSPTTSTSTTTLASPTTSQYCYNSTSPSTSTEGHTVPLYTPYVAGVGGVLVLMGLGGIIYWRYRVQRRGQTVSREGQTGQRRDQLTQDDVMYSTVTHINTTRPTPRAMDKGENTEYVAIKLK